MDALLGTGASGPPRPPVAALLDRLLDLELPVVAVDGPTGVDLLSGTVHGAPRADLTVTFGGFRRGHLLARDEVGTIVVADIGHPPPEPGVADAGDRTATRPHGCHASTRAITRAPAAAWWWSAATRA